MIIIFIVASFSGRLRSELFKFRVKPVLNRVVCATRQRLCDLAPLVAELLMQLQDQAVLGRRPLFLADVGVEVVVPPLATLLANPTWESLGYGAPVSGALVEHHLTEDVVFFLGPRSFGDEGVILEHEPPVKALDL